MKRIDSKAEYLSSVGGRLDEALRRADAIRNIELELYWRRAAYFWAFSAAALAGYVALRTSAAPNAEMLVIVTCLGTVLTWAWYLANRGGKYWLENWELQVDLLEDEVSGPVYKTNLRPGGSSIFHPLNAYPFSVTRLNHLLSLFLTVVWAVLLFSAAREAGLGLSGRLTPTGVILLVTIASVVALPIFGRSSRTSEDRPVRLVQREYPAGPKAETGSKATGPAGAGGTVP